jgi:hypothetical protein
MRRVAGLSPLEEDALLVAMRNFVRKKGGVRRSNTAPREKEQTSMDRIGNGTFREILQPFAGMSHAVQHIRNRHKKSNHRATTTTNRRERIGRPGARSERMEVAMLGFAQ